MLFVTCRRRDEHSSASRWRQKQGMTENASERTTLANNIKKPILIDIISFYNKTPKAWKHIQNKVGGFASRCD
jgi:hypothetical protein